MYVADNILVPKTEYPQVSYTWYSLLYMYLDGLCTDLSCKTYRVPYMVSYKDAVSTHPIALHSRVEITGLSSQSGMSFRCATPCSIGRTVKSTGMSFLPI